MYLNSRCLFDALELCNIKVMFNTIRLRQIGQHLADSIFKSVFLDENVQISINILLKFVSNAPVYNVPTFV